MCRLLKHRWLAGAVAGIALLASTVAYKSYAQPRDHGFDDQGHHLRHVLLISIDGMHAVDFINCVTGQYCPNLAALGSSGVNYLETSTSKPSDSFPGLTALVSGSSPRPAGAFYDVAYDRSLDPPALTTGNGVAGAPLPPARRRNSTRASTSTRPSSMAERRPASTVELPRLTTGNWSAIPRRIARPSTPGTSSAPTRFLESFTRPAVTPRGVTSILPILRFPAPATAPTWTTTILRRSTRFR